VHEGDESNVLPGMAMSIIDVIAHLEEKLI
jgi:hypothetical protein